MTGKQRVAFVLPIHDEEPNIGPLYGTLIGVTEGLLDRYDLELVFVDDGSTDGSLARLLEVREEDPRVTVLSFSRNFGHQLAVTAGLDHVDADAVIVMDSDLQDPPRVALELIERWEQGAEVVYAQRRSRQDTLFKRATAHAFYWTLDRLSAVRIPRNTGDFRLMDRRVVDELRQYREHSRFLRGMVSHVGFRQEAVLFDRDARLAGSTGYPLRKMIAFAVDGILGFSTMPLQLISRLGAVISACAFLGVLWVVGQRLLVPESTVPGWAFVTVSVFLIGGLQLVMLGVIGAYVGRIYIESQNRPLYTLAMRLPAVRPPSGAALPDPRAAVLR